MTVQEEEMNKYRIEKALHEIIRDIPDAERIATRFERGLLTLEDCLEEIAFIIKKEKQ